jgi:hypothetical protein
VPSADPLREAEDVWNSRKRRSLALTQASDISPDGFISKSSHFGSVVRLMASGRRENRSRSGKGFRELMRFDCWPPRRRSAYARDAEPIRFARVIIVESQGSQTADIEQERGIGIAFSHMARKTTFSAELRCPNCGTKIVPSPKEMKQWRADAGLNQRQLGARLRISASYIAYLETGQRTPSPSLIQRYWSFARRIKKPRR